MKAVGGITRKLQIPWLWEDSFPMSLDTMLSNQKVTFSYRREEQTKKVVSSLLTSQNSNEKPLRLLNFKIRTLEPSRTPVLSFVMLFGNLHTKLLLESPEEGPITSLLFTSLPNLSPQPQTPKAALQRIYPPAPSPKLFAVIQSAINCVPKISSCCQDSRVE